MVPEQSFRIFEVFLRTGGIHPIPEKGGWVMTPWEPPSRT